MWTSSARLRGRLSPSIWTSATPSTARAGFYENSEIIRDCFRKLGPWIASCHAKDLSFIRESNVHFIEVIPGRGQMDYWAYLTELAKLPVEAPLMLEHLKNAAEYDEGRAYIQKTAREAGVAFA